MDTPTFLEWLDGKMEQAGGKLIPPPAVVAKRLRDETRALIRCRLVDEALLHARIEERTGETLDGLRGEFRRAKKGLVASIRATLADDPALPWTVPVADAAAKVAGNGRHIQPAAGAETA